MMKVKNSSTFIVTSYQKEQKQIKKVKILQNISFKKNKTTEKNRKKGAPVKILCVENYFWTH